MRKPLEPLHCRERVSTSPGEDVHPGWVRATAILLRGLERLRTQGPAPPEGAEDPCRD